jgi:hypothetical protein
MKTKLILIAVVALLFLQPNFLSAQAFKVKTYKMTIKGTSSLHDWESEVEKLECNASYLVDANTLIDIKNVLVKIPVQSIKSTKGNMMDNKTQDAFKYHKNPWIIFTLSSEKIDPNDLTAELKGTLAMAGTTKAIDLVISYKMLPNGDLQFTGSKKIKMTEFNMEPPTAMMGTIKVGDEVVIGFNLVFSNTNSTL